MQLGILLPSLAAYSILINQPRKMPATTLHNIGYPYFIVCTGSVGNNVEQIVAKSLDAKK